VGRQKIERDIGGYMRNRAIAILGVLGSLLFAANGHAQITPLGDAFTNSADPTTNYGAATLLEVDGATATTYIQFNLASIPSGATVSQATLKLYVNAVTTAGSFNVDYVNGSWAESTIDHSNAPALGTTIASNVDVTTADKNQYILVNVTTAVQAWLSGSETNDGIALVANSTFNATFDSKENTTTSHPAELDIAYAGGDGTITGVTTASGSGLTGGGTSGALNLSLTTACSSGQVLSWNGSAWGCSSGGTGTITGVTAGVDLTGGGTTGNVTLNLNTSALNSTYAQLAAANTFTGNQTVNGNLSATGVVTGSAFQIGSNLFDFGSYANGNAFLGFAGNTTTTGDYNTAVGQQALYSNTTGLNNTAEGLQALYNNTQGSGNIAIGNYALTSNTTGSPNNAFGFEALAGNTTGGPNDAFGYRALYSNTTGYQNDAFGYEALYSNTGGSGNGSANDAFGYQALYSNTTGNNNDAFGNQVLYSNTTGFNNSAFGIQALYSNTMGYNNSAVGEDALYANTTGANNSAVGAVALYSNTTGSENTAAGDGALSTNTTGSDLTCVGYFCTVAADALSNATAIGAHAVVGQSNSLVLGGTGDYAVKVGIGTTTPSNILTIGRGTGHPVSDSWETYSSRRWKTNIKTLPDALAKVEQLRGVSYDLKDSGKHEIGVIAEEVGRVVPEVVSYEKNGRDATGVDYSRLTALLIEATKEQQALIRKQQQQIRRQKAQLKAQQAELRAQQARGESQDARMAELTSQVKAIQASLKTNGRTGAEVHTAKAQAEVVRQ
jgi:hypothetical protein